MPFEGVPLGELLDGFGTVVVIVLVGWMVFRGSLVPKRYYEREIARADKYEEAARIYARQVDTLLHKADTQTTILQDIQEKSSEKGGAS